MLGDHVTGDPSAVHHLTNPDQRVFSMKRSTTAARAEFEIAGVALCLGLAALSPRGCRRCGPAGPRRCAAFTPRCSQTMRNGAALGPRGRYAQIEPVVRRLFDIPFMTRLAVGPEWAGLTEAQRQEVSQAFEHYIAAIYAERFDSYSGERLQVTGEQPSAGGTVITSQIVKSNGKPVNINYLMRAEWRRLADRRCLSRRDDQRTGDAALRIRRDPARPGHHRVDRDAQHQGRHAARRAPPRRRRPRAAASPRPDRRRTSAPSNSCVCSPSKRRAGHDGRRIRQFDRAADGLIGAAGRIIDVDDHLARLQMRVGQDFAGVLHRAARHAGLAQEAHRLVLGARSGPFLDDRVERGAVLPARRRSAEARVVGQFGPADRRRASPSTSAAPRR